MSAAEYPNLGFDPAPGEPGDVEEMSDAVARASSSLTRAGELLDTIRRSDAAVWQGEAASAFRSSLDQGVVADLSKAQESMTLAVGVLRGWHGDLLGFRTQAAELEREAGEARAGEKAAREADEKARGNPDLGLAGRDYTDPRELRAAQARLDAAESAVRETVARVEEAETRLGDVLRRARQLEEEYRQAADRAARALLDAEGRLAPQALELLSRIGQGFVDAAKAVGKWVEDHKSEIHSVLSTTAAIAGLVAALTPPPIDAIALGVAVVAGAGALAIDLSDPKFRHQMGRLLHGHIDGQSLGAGKTLVGDSLSLLPIYGAGNAAVKGLGVADRELPRVVEIAAYAAHNPGIPAKLISRNPKVGELLKALKLIDKTENIERTRELVNIALKGENVLKNAVHDIQEATQ